MWCRSCRQDVPAVASAGGSRACFRCGSPLASNDAGARHTVGVAEMATSGVDLSPPPESTKASAAGIDDWELDRDARRLRRFVERPASAAFLQSSARAADYAPPAKPRSRRDTARGYRDRDDSTRGSALAWLLISLGLMACLCGGALVGWWYATGREDLWNLGLPIAAGGQMALLVGLVLQIERVWHGNREAARRLRNVDRRLQQIKRSADELAAAHHVSAGAFYRHYADGASPNLLLADLKGQLDLLFTRLSAR